MQVTQHQKPVATREVQGLKSICDFEPSWVHGSLGHLLTITWV